MTLCSKKISGTILTTRLNMVFNFLHFVKNVLGVIHKEFLTGNVVIVLIDHINQVLLACMSLLVLVSVYNTYQPVS